MHLLGGSETFQDKVNFFQRELRHIHSKRPRTKTCLKISRPSLLESVSKSGRSLHMGHIKQVSEQYRKTKVPKYSYSHKPAPFISWNLYFFCVVQTQNSVGIKRDAFPPFLVSEGNTELFCV